MSLRVKVIFGVLLIDLLIFGVLVFLVPKDLQLQKERELRARTQLFDLFYALASAIPESDKQGPDLNSILAWPHWDSFADALVMEGKVAHTPIVEEAEKAGVEPVAVGLFFNPRGRYKRSTDFDSLARKQIVEAIDRKQVIETENTIALPIVRQTGGKKEIWGGGYFVLKETDRPLLSIRGILMLSVASMFLLAFFTYFTLSKLVLRPVEILADASQKVASGDLSITVPVPNQKDELSELVRSFDEMVVTLRGHQEELKREVKIATEKASQAERDLLTAQRLAAMGTLAAGIAHEINNPLGGMLNAIRALDKKELPPAKRAEYLEIVLSGLERIRNTVSRVLQVSPRAGERAQVSLEKSVQNARVVIEHRLEAEKIHLISNVTPADLSVRASSAEVEQLFLNLFLNSIDALLSRRKTDFVFAPEIQVHASQGNDTVRIRVEDNGCGMKSSLVSRSLDPFFTTKDVGKGSGLGLSIVYSIVKGLGGQMELWSEEGKGFRVTISLPKPGSA